MSKELKKEKNSQEASDTIDEKNPAEEIEVSVEDDKIDASAEASDQAVEETKSLEQQLTEAQEEAADLRDKMLRLAADYENFKKRIERERAVTMKYAGEYIFKEVLPVVDNLERAISQGVIEGADAEHVGVARKATMN